MMESVWRSKGCACSAGYRTLVAGRKRPSILKQSCPLLVRLARANEIACPLPMVAALISEASQELHHQLVGLAGMLLLDPMAAAFEDVRTAQRRQCLIEPSHRAGAPDR